MRYPWDQLPDESVVEYRRFMCYVHFGPLRSIDKAYRKWCKQVAGEDEAKKRAKTAPGNWTLDSRKFRWRERAAAWDVARIRMHGPRLVVLWVRGAEKLAERALRGVRKYDIGQPEWAEVLDSFRTVALFLTPEGVRAVAEAARQPVPDGDAADEPVGGTAAVE